MRDDSLIDGMLKEAKKKGAPEWAWDSLDYVTHNTTHTFRLSPGGAQMQIESKDGQEFRYAEASPGKLAQLARLLSEKFMKL